MRASATPTAKRLMVVVRASSLTVALSARHAVGDAELLSSCSTAATKVESGVAPTMTVAAM